MMAASSDSDDIVSPESDEDDSRLLIDLIPDAVIVTTKASIVFANPAALNLFEAGTEHELIERHILNLVDDSSLGLAMIRLADPPAIEHVFPYRLRRRNGDPFDAELTGRNIVFRGRPSRLLVIRDITERNRLHEHALQASRRDALSEMTTELMHDLSQPLNVIRLAAEGAVLMIERGKPSIEWLESQFALIAEQSERTAQSLEDIRMLIHRETDTALPTADPAPIADRHAEAHILVVESDSAATATLVDYLDGLGCRVSIARSGKDAWNRFHHDPADVVIIDPHTTADDGEDLVSCLRDFDPLLPIIVTSNQFYGREWVSDRYHDGRYILLNKPLDLPEIGRLIAAFLLPPPEDPLTSI
ncbi:PAS domain-containing protein [Magnetospirillum molischianum]|uniref:histidine kinase n=1 Tax=Magnetospirillum molischianum DSM 120 TaxID=1150626 RepID=H8FV68_MAGML|nr:PAS domain-containing protein [Magnetospirillum molischianum]CCG42256.1 Putative two-component response transcriptional regulator (CheY family); hypothetical protein [Magnetospirillum molischianum DSM 120]